MGSWGWCGVLRDLEPCCVSQKANRLEIYLSGGALALACRRHWVQPICFIPPVRIMQACLQFSFDLLALTLDNLHPLISSENIYLERQDKNYMYSLCFIFRCRQSILEDLTSIRMFLSLWFQVCFSGEVSSILNWPVSHKGKLDNAIR